MKLTSAQTLWFCLIVWMIAISFTIIHHWRQSRPGVGLVMAHILNMWMIHWLPGALYLMPWYSQPRPIDVMIAGMWQSLYATLAFCGGCYFSEKIIKKKLLLGPGPIVKPASIERVSYFYMLFGLFCYFVLFPLGGRLPSITSLVSNGWNLFALGLALQGWRSLTEGKRLHLLKWLLGGMLLPIITVSASGFMSFGIFLLIVLASFLSMYYRPRWHVVLFGVLGLYIFLSVYVTYMRDRGELREVIWGGSEYSERFSSLWQTAVTLEAFNIFDESHLWRIDDRLNLTSQVGQAVNVINEGHKDLAWGDTLIDSALALVPRAIWWNKSVKAGSGTLVEEYTGFNYNNETTSVGIGQVMEMYINFGTTGVVVGFFLIGLVVTWFDQLAAGRLYAGDWPGFAFWFLPGLGFLGVGGSFVELTATMASGFILMLLINQFLLPRVLTWGRRTSVMKWHEP